MKSLRFAFLLALGVVACRSTNFVTPPDVQPQAVFPTIGSTYNYDYSSTGPNPGDTLQVVETVMISRFGLANNISQDSEFTAKIVKHDLTGDTTGSETFVVLKNGDLGLPDKECGPLALPIATHRSYTPPSATVATKINGYVAQGSVVQRTDYLADETLTVGSETFACSKVQFSITVTAASGTGPGKTVSESVVHTYWYCSRIGYFVREEESGPSLTGGASGKHWTRMLTSYRIP